MDRDKGLETHNRVSAAEATVMDIRPGVAAPSSGWRAHSFSSGLELTRQAGDSTR